MSYPTKCKECGGSDLYWFTTNVNKTGIAEGRLRTHEPTCRFVLGCHDCSETLAAVDADRIADRMNSEQSELAALREELAKSAPIYQSEWLGDGGGRWIDITAEQYEHFSKLAHYNVRVVYSSPCLPISSEEIKHEQ